METNRHSFSNDDEVEKTFHEFDRDHNSKLTGKEIIAGLKRIGLPHEEKDVMELIKKADLDSSGDLSLEEFKSFVRKRRDELRVLFDSLDTNKNGLIEADEIKKSLESLNIETDDEFVEKLIKGIDKNSDGSISFEEWTELLTLVPKLQMEDIIKYWEDAASMWIDADIPFPTKKEKSIEKQLKGMLAGAVAGIIAKTATAPLERLKVIYQVETNPPPMWTVLRNIWQESGWRGFFRSNGANLLKIAPEMGFKFWSFEAIKGLFSENEDEVTPTQRLIAGGLAGASAHTIVYPLDVVKTRMAATSGKHSPYSGIMSSVRSIQVNEGYFFPFFKGWSMMVLSTLPSNALTLGVFSTLKHFVASRSKSGEASASAIAGCSTVSSIFGSIVTYPLGVIKSRLQVQGIPGKEKQFNGLVDAVTKTYVKEGFRGFYRGIVPTLLKHVPSQTMAFMTYEFLRREFGLEAKKKH